MTMNMGTQRVATFGARPKTTNRSVKGMKEITVLSPFTNMVSRGKHSRGNWVLASSALLARSELPPLPREEAKKLQHMMPTNE